MGVSENRGPEYSTSNSRILIIRTPKQNTLIFGKTHISKGSMYLSRLLQSCTAKVEGLGLPGFWVYKDYVPIGP